MLFINYDIVFSYVFGNMTKHYMFHYLAAIVLAISKLTTLTVESLCAAPTENAKHHIMAIDEAS